MLVLCTAIFAIGLGGTGNVGQSFYDAFIDPSVQEDIEIRQRRFSDNVEIINNTRLFLSTQMTTLNEKAEVLQPHIGTRIVDVVPALSDDKLVGPQGSLLSGGWSTVVAYDKPNGRNSLVTVLTAGLADGPELTPEEYKLWKHLLGRTIADQFFVPVLNWACGVTLDSKETIGVIAGMITGHNTQILEQLRDAAKSGSPTDFAYAVWQFCVREIETGGPIASYLARKLGFNLAKRMAERAALKTIITFVPGANAVEKFLFLLNTGGTLANMIPAAWDLLATPARLEYRVYYVPGLGDVLPKIVRIDGKDDEITLVGHKLLPVPGKTFRVKVFDKNAGKIFETTDLQTVPSGRTVTFTLPESAVGNSRGPLEFELTIDKFVVKDPEKVEIIQDLKVLRLVPDHGPPGTRVRIIAEGIYPYVTTNTVFVQAPGELTPMRATTELVSKSWIEFTVPDIVVSQPTAHDVYVEENAGRVRKQSRKLQFKVEPGTAAETAQKYRESMMPEATFTFSGTLDSTTARTHPFEVPAGMQVEVELMSVSGPDSDRLAGELADWNLYLITSPQGRPLAGYALSDPFRDIKSGQPSQRITHTTGGFPVINTYGISLHKKSAQPVSYKFEVRLFRKDDAGSGRDAGDTFERALPIRNNERLRCSLSAEKKHFREDLKDIYRIDGIADDKEIVITISGAPTTYPFRNKEGTIQRARLYCQGENDIEPYPVAWHDEPMGSSSSNYTMVHSARGNRSYFLELEAGMANTEYWVEVGVRPATSPPAPITPVASYFDSSDEGWMLGGNFRTDLKKPAFQSITPTSGYIYATDAAPEETIGPMDVVIAIDTTGSMGNVIQSVRDSTVRIIEELRRRTSSLQIGLVSFKDIAADGAIAGRSIVPLSANVEQVLASVRSWSASGGGNDGPEDLLFALKGALQSSWRTKDEQGRRVARVVIAITDVPPKMNASGADFDGNTLTSITNLADSAGVRVFPVIVSQDVAAMRAAEGLAFGTGGKALQLADQKQAADALLEACFSAVEPSSPMYWVAPQKFLGEKSRFFGRNLLFSLYCYMTGLKNAAEPFFGDDIILEGSGTSISFVGGIRPYRSVLNNEWNHYSVPLDSRGQWIDTTTRKRVDDTTIIKVLGALTALKIRADHYFGSESIHLDNVVLGSQESITDRGLDENAKKLFALLERWKMMSENLSKQIDDEWTTFEADQAHEKVFTSRLGSTDGLTSHMQWTSTVTLNWLAVTTPGVRERGFHEIQKLCADKMDQLRKTGTATPAEYAAKTRDFEEWRIFANSVNGRMNGMLKLAVDICLAEKRLASASLSVDEADKLRKSADGLRKQFDDAKQALLRGADLMLGKWN